MAGTITPSKHKYMSDFHPPEKKFWIHAWHNAMLIESEHRLCCNAINVQRSQDTFELPLLKCKIRNNRIQTILLLNHLLNFGMIFMYMYKKDIFKN